MSVQTLPFGELALLEDFITREQLHAVLEYQAERREAAKPDRKLGTLLVHQGYLTRDEAREILRLQRERGPIDGYVLLQRLGSGGMGTVYRAIQKSLEREVALKILTPKATRHDRFRARFLQEAKLLAQLKHPNLVRAFEVGETRGHLYFAMEYVRGRTARDLITRYGHIPEVEVLDYLEQVTLAIEHYDEHRIIHRDIKPENILITDDGQAKLADLGLSKRLDEDAHITRPGKTLGTPLYISPELARGDETIDIRSDLYSLGATFYHLATGVPPFQHEGSADLLTAHVRDIPKRPREVNPILSEELDALLVKLLEKRPDKRFQTPRALIEAIERVRRGEMPDEPLAAKLRRKRGSSDEANRESNDPDARPLGASGSGSKHRAARRDSNRARNGRRTGTGTFPAVGSEKTRKGTAPSGRSGLVAFGVILVAALVGIGAAASGSLFAGPARPRDPVAELVALASQDPSGAVSEARSYESRHATEPDLVLERYAAILAALPPSSPIVPELRAAHDRVHAAIEQQATAAFEELRLDVRDLVELGRPDEARAKIAAFPKRFRKTSVWSKLDEVRAEVR